MKQKNEQLLKSQEKLNIVKNNDDQSIVEIKQVLESNQSSYRKPELEDQFRPQQENNSISSHKEEVENAKTAMNFFQAKKRKKKMEDTEQANQVPKDSLFSPPDEWKPGQGVKIQDPKDPNKFVEIPASALETVQPQNENVKFNAEIGMDTSNT